MNRIIGAFPAERPVPAAQPAAVDLEQLWAIYRDLRDARGQFGLGSSIFQTLQAMISFLRNGGAPVVFASNRSIVQRAGLTDERTLRRHIRCLVEAGLITRQDSPNRKRYKASDPETGEVLAYGFSLAPLIRRAEEITGLAAEIRASALRCGFLRKKLLALLAQLDEHLPLVSQPLRKLLRRKISVADYEAAITAAEGCLRERAAAEPTADPRWSPAPSNAIPAPESMNMSARAGLNDRHHSMSEKKDMDSDKGREAGPVDNTCRGNPEAGDEMLLKEAIRTCTEAVGFASEPVETVEDLEQLARNLAPMMGIDENCYRQACARHPWSRVALTVLLILQLGRRVRNMPAYFRSVMTGRRASSFDAVGLLKRLSQASATAH